MGSAFLVSWKACRAMPICLRLLMHCVRAAASRTFWTAGTSSAIRIAMIAMTTSNSIRVNPDRFFGCTETMKELPGIEMSKESETLGLLTNNTAHHKYHQQKQ